MHKCPPHHWLIDSFNVGHCIEEGCNAVKDFNKLQEYESGLLALKSTNSRTRNYSRKRGRPRKENRQDPEYRARQSAGMKAAWQDSEYRARQRVSHTSLPGRHHKKEETLIK